MTSSKLGIGFIGSGFNTRFHIRSWVGVRDADVRGVWSPKPLHAEEAASLAKQLHGAKDDPGQHKSMTGVEHIDKVIVVDQTPIGRTPRSNPATYTGLWGPVRDLFAMLPASKARGYKPGRFSFQRRCFIGTFGRKWRLLTGWHPIQKRT